MVEIKFIVMSIFSLLGLSIAALFSDVIHDIKEDISSYIIPSTSSLYAFINLPFDTTYLVHNIYFLGIIKLAFAVITAIFVAAAQFFIKRWLNKTFKK